MTEVAPNNDEHVSSSRAVDIFDDRLLHNKTRQHIISIVTEYVDSVQFMKKVREYASDEMDARLFTSAKFWITTIASAVVTAGIGVLIGYFVK